MTSRQMMDYDINKPDNLLNDLKNTVNKTTDRLSSQASQRGKTTIKRSTDYDINNPDKLLNDIKNTVNKTSDHLSRSRTSLNDVGIDSGLLEPHLNGTKILETKTIDSSKPSHCSVLGSPSLVRKVLNETQTRHRSSSPFEHEIKVDKISRTPKTTNEVKFDIEPTVDTTPNSTMKRSYYAKTTTHHRPYKTEVVETTDLPPELKNAAISDDLLPQPGTKVTTTIKTFSYEIPEDKQVPTNKNFTFKNEYYNSQKSSNIYYPDTEIIPGIKTTNYSSESSNTLDRTIPLNTVPGQTKYYYKKEVNETKNNINGPLTQPSINSTSFYERNIKNDTENIFSPSATTPVFQNDNLTPGTKQTYLYKKETTNTTNTIYEPPPQPQPTTEKYYKYSSTTTTKQHGSEPLVGPFPTENIPTQIDSTPKNLNQLMSTFEKENVNVDEEPYVPRKEVNTALAPNKNAPIDTKNVTGPPVYYPPGKELFAKSEAQGALRARGGFGKGSGKYEYEAESKSKNASKSGATMVPVCFPLCCAMPCSIM